jgi:outer membrane protein assembly factor BamB
VLDARTARRLDAQRRTRDNTKTPFWGFSSSPLVIGDIVIVAAPDNSLLTKLPAAINAGLDQHGGGSYSSPHLVTINGVAQVLLTATDVSTSVSPRRRQTVVANTTGGQQYRAAGVDGGRQRLITSQEAGIRRLASRTTGRLERRGAWTSNGLKPYFNDFVVIKATRSVSTAHLLVRRSQ